VVQRGNFSAGSPNYGKSSEFSGRELKLVFGLGSSTSSWSITSHLEINDYDWHFVSVAYDTVNNIARFGVDDTFETVSFNDNPRVTNSGPLRVGSHQNGAGVDNFFLRGTIDEMRISRGVVPVEELLNVEASSYSQDANANGIPDECEVDVPGDLDGDGDVDNDDFAIFADCMSGPDIPYSLGCDAADLNVDGDVDVADFAEFQLHFGTGQ